MRGFLCDAIGLERAEALQLCDMLGPKIVYVGDLEQPHRADYLFKEDLYCAVGPAAAGHEAVQVSAAYQG